MGITNQTTAVGRLASNSRKTEERRYSMTPVLNLDFNILTVHMASKLQWIPVDYDPYPTLADMQADYDKTGRIKVSTLHSDNSIYGDPFVNWCGRAWHDYAHLEMNAEFDADGECKAASYQIEQLQNRVWCGQITAVQAEWFARIIDAEVNG
jgi:hypothetical protein